jgi:hypothetical protein
MAARAGPARHQVERKKPIVSRDVHVILQGLEAQDPRSAPILLLERGLDLIATEDNHWPGIGVDRIRWEVRAAFSAARRPCS